MAAQSQALSPSEQSLVIRRATPADADVCGRICFEAFGQLAAHHNFPLDFPAPEVAIGLLSMMFSHPAFFCVVAEQHGKIIGSNCLDERTNRSLSLYAKLGFVVREPLSCMQGPAIQKTPPGYRVRPAQAGDLAACNDLCLRVHGHDRGGELNDAIQQGTAVVAESRGRVTAYASSVAFFGHAVGDTNEDLEALIATATAFQGPGILVPTRNAGLFRWCLESGLRVVQQMTLMTMGLYNEPAGAYLPSVLF